MLKVFLEKTYSVLCWNLFTCLHETSSQMQRKQFQTDKSSHLLPAIQRASACSPVQWALLFMWAFSAQDFLLTVERLFQVELLFFEITWRWISFSQLNICMGKMRNGVSGVLRMPAYNLGWRCWSWRWRRKWLHKPKLLYQVQQKVDA